MDWSSPGAVYGQLRPLGLVVALAIAGVEYAVLVWAAGRMGRGRVTGVAGENTIRVSFARLALGSSAVFLIAATLFPAVIVLVQIPLQTALGRWVMAGVATANQAVLALPVILLSGFVQEPAKLLVALAGILPAGLGLAGPAGLGFAAPAGRAPAERLRRKAVRRAILLGAVAGAGFGAFEAAFFLSQVFATAGAMAPGLDRLGAAAPAVIERVSAVLFHLSLTGIAVYFWTFGPVKGLAALGGVSLIHGLVNYVAVLAAGLSGSVATTEALVAAAALTVFGWFVYLIRPSAATGPRPGNAGTRVTLAATLMVVVAAGFLVAGCRPKAQPLTLEAPWAAGEFSRLESVNTDTGAKIADWEFGVEAEAGGQGWVLVSLTRVPQGTDRAAVHVSTGDLTPSLVEFEFKDEKGLIVATGRAVYSDGKVLIASRSSGQDQPVATVKLPGLPYFDNEEIVFALRALPLAEGWQATLNDVVSRSAGKTQVRVTVSGKETVSVPQGTYECWVVAMPALAQKAWIAVEAPHQLVQYANEAAKTLSKLVEYRPGQ